MRVMWIGLLLSVLTALFPSSFGTARAAQLSITKSVNPDPMIIGAESTYTVTVTNTGDQDAAGVTMTDTLDPNVTVGALPSGCSASGQVVTCGGDSLTLGPGDSQSWDIPVTVDPALPDGTNVTNRAQVSSTTPGVQPKNTQLISQTQTTTDVEITKSGSPATVSPGDLITYTITVTNFGPSEAVDVTVQDPTNGNLTTIVQLPPECPPSGLTVTCPLGTLAPGETRTFTFTVRVNDDVPAGTLIDNCATVYTGSRESNSDNNYSCADTDVEPTASPTPSPTGTPDLSINKSGPATIGAGGIVTYTVVIRNTGTATAYNVMIRDPIDPNVTIVSAPEGCTIVGRQLTCRLVSLPAGEERTYQLTLKVADDAAVGTTVDNCAVIYTISSHPLTNPKGSCVESEVTPTPSPTSPTPTPTPTPTKTTPGPTPTPTGTETPTPVPTAGPGPGPDGSGDGHVSPGGPLLPYTGAPTAWLGLLAAVLVGLGGAALIVSRSRKPRA